uniref:Uncharacterized protein n=1 Tax=Aegilops tauschii TaxID=37682 RepID=M8BW60_AEGTA
MAATSPAICYKSLPARTRCYDVPQDSGTTIYAHALLDEAQGAHLDTKESERDIYKIAKIREEDIRAKSSGSRVGGPDLIVLAKCYQLEVCYLIQQKERCAIGAKSQERKIELAINFITAQSNRPSHGHRADNIQLLRMVSFIGNWVQSILSKKVPEPFDPVLDYRCWEILRFCIEKKPSISISLNLLLKPLGRVAKDGLSRVQSGASYDDHGSFLIFERGFECVSFLFSSNTRAFFNAGVDLWTSCVTEAINLVQKVSTNEKKGCTVLQNLGNCLFEQFSSFLRFHANPKNIFRPFVDKILDPLLELLVLINSQANSNKHKLAGSTLKIAEEILSNGLFHPQHLSGYFGLKNLKASVKDVKGSYHRHLFERFKGIKAESKAVLLAGFGYLLQLFVTRARNQRTSLAPRGTSFKSPQKSSEGSEEPQQQGESIFEVFMQFMEPLMLECKSYSQKDFSDLGVTKLVEVDCMLKFINEMLATVTEEKIYVPTEDTSEGSYLQFLQEIYRVLILMAEKMYDFWVSALHLEDANVKKMLPLMFVEIVVAVGYFLEIEYKVAHSICTLCNTVRTFRAVAGPDVVPGPFSVVSLSSHECFESLATLLSSQTLRDAICTSINSMPEGQSSRCIEELTVDLTDTLKWMKSCDEVVDLESQGEPRLMSRKSVFHQRAELFGRSLYLQSVGLMPPDLAIEATELVGNSFIVCCGKEWTNTSNIIAEGYFAWIVESAGSLLEVIEILSQSLPRNQSGFTTLFYTLHVMALQRLEDLNRQINAFAFLLEDSTQQFDTEDRGNILGLVVSSVCSFLLGLIWNDCTISQEIIGLSHEIFGEHTDQKKNTLFSLVDKTSEIFSTLANMNSKFCLLGPKKQTGSSLKHTARESDTSEHDDQAFDTLENSALEHVKTMAEQLEKTTVGIPVTAKDRNCVIKIENSYDNVCWDKLLCTMSCIGGFLWGLVSAFESIIKDYPTASSEEKKLMLHYASNFSRSIAKFETFVDICLHVLFMENKDFGSIDLISGHLPQELDCENGFLNIEVVMDGWTMHQLKDNKLQSDGPPGMKRSLLKNLLDGEGPFVAFTLRELYSVSAAIVKLKGLISFSGDFSTKACNPFQHLSLNPMVGTACNSLQKIADMSDWPDMFSPVWIDGILRYLDVLGTFPELNLSKELHAQIVNAHVSATGKCILLQVKSATLPTHEVGSSTKTLHLQNTSGYVVTKNIIDRQNRLNSLISRLRLSMRNVVSLASNMHLSATLQVIERALVGVNQYSHSIYEVKTGTSDGGTVSSDVAAGIDCLYLVLGSVPG